MPLTRLSRDEFLDGYFEYLAGQHLAIIYPTGGGKTHLKYQLLREAMRQQPQLSVRVTMPKRKDPPAARWNAALGLREVPKWPPPASWRKPPGYALWPRHIIGQPGQDPEKVLAANRAHIERQLKICAQDSYQLGNCIHDADDIYVQAVIYHMNEYFNEMLTMGGIMGCGLWGENQKPSGTPEGSVTSFFYSAPTHLFLGYDREERNRKRFGEIGGVDSRYVSELVLNELRLHRIYGADGRGHDVSDVLYISKAGTERGDGPAMCIIGP
jgi:hypothetical protein